MNTKSIDLFGGGGQLNQRQPGALTLDQYINLLVELRQVMGGQVIVQKWLPSKGRHNAPPPAIAHAFKAIAHGQAKEIAGQFWDRTDREDQKGDPVIRV